jgi:hypothetical protein
LLRARRQRPRGRAAEEREEIATLQVIELHLLPLALLWQNFCFVADDFGFPNQFFSDSWVVGFWRADHDWDETRLEE